MPQLLEFLRILFYLNNHFDYHLYPNIEPKQFLCLANSTSNNKM